MCGQQIRLALDEYCRFASNTAMKADDSSKTRKKGSDVNMNLTPMNFDLKDGVPEIIPYFNLYETTGWNAFYKADMKEIEKSISNSWYSVCAYSASELIGFGRVISDGTFYGIICDMIVLPTYQNMGVGSAILTKLKQQCVSEGLRVMWLFSAAGKAAFYKRHGFEERPDNAPGMQIKLY